MWLTNRTAAIHLITGCISLLILLSFSYHFNFTIKWITLLDKICFCVYLLICLVVIVQIWYATISLCNNHCVWCQLQGCSQFPESPPSTETNIHECDEGQDSYSQYPYIERNYFDKYTIDFFAHDIIQTDSAAYIDPEYSLEEDHPHLNLTGS